MMTTPTTSDVPLRSLRIMNARLAALGVDTNAWLAEHEITPAQLLDPAAEMPRAAWLDAWRRADELAREPAFGVHVAGLAPVQLFIEIDHETEFLVMQLAASAPTVEDALVAYTRYHWLSGPELAFERIHDRAIVRVVSINTPPALVEMTLALVAKLLQLLAAKPTEILEVRLVRAAPADVSEHRRAFGNVRFAATENAIEIPATALALPMRVPRPHLFASLERRASTLALERSASRFSDEVATALQTRLQSRKDSRAASLARELGVSVRTMARRLDAEHTSHRAILDRVRAEMSQRYLDDGLAVKEVADVLGFADASAFHRAYRRWFGHSPSARPASTR
jgi:AraC-like DNA-binding protein